MNLTSPRQVKEWCAANGFRPNRTLGQNFLIDLNVREAMVEAGMSGRRVLEIGPGLGVLTEALLARGASVVAIEKDPALAGRLAAARGGPTGRTAGEGAALAAAERPEAFGLDLGSFDCLVSSLPYQSGTRILLELVLRRQPPAMTVLVQTEVAERLAAGPGGRTRGLAGVWAQLDYDVRIVRRVSANYFWPRPEVGSSVVRLDLRPEASPLTENERECFYRITKTAFEHRRKQLGNVFKDVVQSTARAEELSNADWIELAKGLSKGKTENEDA